MRARLGPVSDVLLSALDRSQTGVREAVALHERKGNQTGELSFDLQVAQANSEFHGAIARSRERTSAFD